VSEPATVVATIPTEPPTQSMLRAAEPTRLHEATVRNGRLSGMGREGWALYDDVDLGREQPFAWATVNYVCPERKGGGTLQIIIDPAIDEDSGEVHGGTIIGEHVIQSRGDWNTFQQHAIELRDVPAGSHTVLLRQQVAPKQRVAVQLASIRFSTRQ
jgi:hypothetical protein